MGNQTNRQDENQNPRKPAQPQQTENQGLQQDGTKKAKAGKNRDTGSQQDQNRPMPDQDAGTRH